MIIDQEFGVILQAEVGETVWDDLTKKNCVILMKEWDEHGNLGYWLESEWLDGGRFPWEISPPRL